jgi:hypothetical protein
MSSFIAMVVGHRWWLRHEERGQPGWRACSAGVDHDHVGYQQHNRHLLRHFSAAYSTFSAVPCTIGR